MKFGAWLPDLDQYGHDGLVMARNVLPTPLGYGPVKTYSAVTTALPSAFRGGRTFRGVDGTVKLLVGTDDGLYSWSGTAWDSEVAGSYANDWQFAQFGDLAIAVQGAAPLKYTIGSGVGATLGGTPPNGKYITTVKDFVVIAGVDSANSTVYWSALNNAEGWTAGTDQSDIQIIPDGGEVTGLAGGEYMLVFQRDQIWRGQYVGTPYIFTFDKISQSIGCIAANSIAQAGRTIFFLSSRGFVSFTDGDIVLIGANKVDKTFFEFYSTADIEANVTVAVDPVRKLVIWAMPRRLWCYNWELDRWSDIEGDWFAVSTGATASFTLDQIDALYPGGVETVPGSFDDPIWQGGDPFLMIAANNGTLGSFGAETAQQATLMTPQIEVATGREIRIRSVRIDGDATASALVRIDARKRLGDSAVQSSSASIRGNGDTPVRASGRYIQATVVLAEGAEWSYAQGINYVQASGGARQ